MARAKDRGANEINASSMADIAFLLLIFFLVTTTIEVDKGILHKLPPWVPPDEIPEIKWHKRNTFVVLINSNDQILVNDKPTSLNSLRERAKEFIDNRGVDPNMSESPQEAIVSLQNDRGTSYGIYLEVQNELKAAYRELRDEFAKRKFASEGIQSFEDLKSRRETARREGKRELVDYYSAKIEEVTEEYPLRLSEAEPKDVGEG